LARIRLHNVGVSFPVYSDAGRSLKSAVLKRNVGGNIQHDDGSVTVVRALTDVNLELNDGDRLGLLGHNGSGKTTLLRVLSRIYDPTSGYTEISGSVTSMTDLMMGMDIEETGYTNIRMRAIFLGLGDRDQEKLIKDVEDFTELGEFLALPIRTYSQGMLLRLCFAVSTAVEPDIVIMDEMISVGDAGFLQKAEERLNSMFERAHILVLASHDLETMKRLCNRAALLEGGRIVLVGEPEDVAAAYNRRFIQNVSAPRRFAPASAATVETAPVIPADKHPDQSPEAMQTADAQTAIAAALGRARAWAINDALPFWSETGFDKQLASFHERVDFAGRPITDIPRRTMVQARQISVFAHAYELGWSKDGGDLALRAAHALLQRHWRADGADGFVFSTDPVGAVADPRRDTYAQAFALYGLAWAYRVDPQPVFRQVAIDTFLFLDNVLAAEAWGGFNDGLPRLDNLRRQNPHMHLLEASLAWFEATADSRFLARAGEIYGHFKTRLFHSPTGFLTEYFDDRWQPAEGRLGRICEPGHHFEWVWLLMKYCRLTTNSVARYTGPLYGHAMQYGRAANGLLVDEFLNDGSTAKASQRCWPHTEAVKAAAAQTEMGLKGHIGEAAAFLEILMDRFLGRPFPGGWIDHFDAAGKPLVDYVPSSTLYHAFLAIAEADRVFTLEPPPTAGP